MFGEQLEKRPSTNLAKTVENPADRCCVVEPHWYSENRREHIPNNEHLYYMWNIIANIV